MTMTDLEPVVDHDAAGAGRSDRALDGFLKFGPIVLVLAIVAFGAIGVALMGARPRTDAHSGR